MPDGTLINVCVHKSDGCRFCYAEGIVKRWWKKEWGEFPGYTAALLKLGMPVLVEEELRAVLKLSKRIAAGKADPEVNKIFWNDMTDEYLEFWPDEFVDKCWAVRALTSNLIHQVLTKRADRLHNYFKNRFTRHYAAKQASTFTGRYDGATGTCDSAICNAEFPYPNVHLGVSCEDQKTADERIPLLLQTPAAVRWISAEPLLAPVDISKWVATTVLHAGKHIAPETVAALKEMGKAVTRSQGYELIDWVVVGAESGPKARPFDLAWARSLVEQCKVAGAPVFVKQLGQHPVDWRHDEPEVPPYEYSFTKKGGDPSEWPEDLRVREFPEARTKVATA